MAKTNYQQLRRAKEAARKNRQQSKLDRRTGKSPSDSAPASVDAPESAVPVLGSDDASK